MTPFIDDVDFQLYVGDVRDVLRELPVESVHTCVTSPPYWGLRDYSAVGQLGLEPTPDAYVAAMVDVFREVRRVLRADGTLWLNLGDSYNAGTSSDRINHTTKDPNDTRAKQFAERSSGRARMDVASLKPKDLVGIPWRVAFALQADGWFLRSDIIWAKPNPMPESVTDRPTKAHEYVFLLSKEPRYFFDQEAVREPTDDLLTKPRQFRNGDAKVTLRQDEGNWYEPRAGRNLRSVWEIATQPYPDAHFATFPEALPDRCVRAGSSERGCCPKCGAPWEREIELGEYESSGPNALADKSRSRDRHTYDTALGDRPPDGYGDLPRRQRTTLGWKPSCDCHGIRGLAPAVRPEAPVPCTVLDPFMGSGTTALVARKLGRRSIGVELNESYAELCARRLQQLSLLAEPA